MEQLTELLRPDELASLRLRGLYQSRGYRRFRINRFEEYGFYMENRRFLANENVLTFTDLDGRLLALKPDITLSIIKNIKPAPGEPERLYYTENVYRPDRQRSGFREIGQIGVEYIGDLDPPAVIEVTALAAESLLAISKDYILDINHMGFFEGFCDELAQEGYLLPSKRLIELVTSKNGHELRRLATECNLPAVKTEALAGMAAGYGEFPAQLAYARQIAGHNQSMLEAIAELNQLYRVMAALGLAQGLRLDFSLILDPAFYSGIVYAGYIAALPGKLLSGGCYERMMNKLGKKSGATGFALYLDELACLPLAEKEFDTDVLVIYETGADSLELAKAVRELIKQGLSVRLSRQKPERPRASLIRRFVDGRLEEDLC